MIQTTDRNTVALCSIVTICVAIGVLAIAAILQAF